MIERHELGDVHCLRPLGRRSEQSEQCLRAPDVSSQQHPSYYRETSVSCLLPPTSYLLPPDMRFALC